MSGGASRQAIEAHYDVGREFYRLWLDERMVYSCALWPGADGGAEDGAGPDGLNAMDDDLERAQTAKLDWHVSAAHAEGAARVLDVGCGWGSLLAYLHDERHVGHVTGLTLSSDQAQTVRERYPWAEVRLEDWRDHQPPERYDAIISIGAFEHFTRRELSTEERRKVYRDFFDRCAAWLVDGGRLSLQTIAYEDFDPAAHPEPTFFDEVFPESALPQLSDIVVASEPSFRLRAYRSDSAHYEHTLHLWQQRLEAQREVAIELVGRATYRHYLRYLRVSRAMFDRGVCTLYRLMLERRPEDSRAQT